MIKNCEEFEKLYKKCKREILKIIYTRYNVRGRRFLSPNFFWCFIKKVTQFFFKLCVRDRSISNMTSITLHCQTLFFDKFWCYYGLCSWALKPLITISSFYYKTYCLKTSELIIQGKRIFLEKMKFIKKRRSNFVLHSENRLHEINLQKKILFYAVLISICNYLHCKCDIVTKNDCNISKNKYEWFEKTWQKKLKLVFYWTYHTPLNLVQNRFTTSTNNASF